MMTDQHLNKTSRDFDWPCDKRRAHGPHVVKGSDADWPYPYVDRDCPGVKAHPATMIGR